MAATTRLRTKGILRSPITAAWTGTPISGARAPQPELAKRRPAGSCALRRPGVADKVRGVVDVPQHAASRPPRSRAASLHPRPARAAVDLPRVSQHLSGRDGESRVPGGAAHPERRPARHGRARVPARGTACRVVAADAVVRERSPRGRLRRARILHLVRDRLPARARRPRARGPAAAPRGTWIVGAD